MKPRRTGRLLVLWFAALAVVTALFLLKVWGLQPPIA